MRKNLPPHQLLGKLGEEYAVSYLTSLGYTLLERNYSIHYGEIDIICLDGKTLVFVEVKCRQTDRFGLPEESVTPKKLREVIKTASWYRQTHRGLPSLERIDVIGLIMNNIGQTSYLRHIINVTG
jgi:putative endonuclease